MELKDWTEDIESFSIKQSIDVLVLSILLSDFNTLMKP
jgi:hypothetical protein